MIVGQHIQWNSLCDIPYLESILNKKLNDYIIATDPTYGLGELTYYYQVDYYNSDIIISVYEYVDGCFVKVTGCGYNNNRVQTVSLVTPTTEPQTETCCTQQAPVQCVPQQPTIPIPSATNDHTKLINKNADANFQHVTLAEKEKWNSQTTDVLGTVLTGLTEASTMTNLESTDTVLGAFGKIKKWLGSLKALAFKDKADYDTDIDNIPTDLVQDANYVHTDNNYTDADAQIVTNTSGTNTGDQDLTPYLLSDTTLQTTDTPEDTSLFSFWKIGVSRVKITWANFKATLKTYFDSIYVPLTLRFEKHTGFYSVNDPRNKKILVTYNGDKTVTLSRSDGTFQGYFDGVPIAGLTNGYTSPVIPTATPTGLWFLYHNGTSIIWSQTHFLFSHCMITIAYFRTDGTFLFIVPETHGFMPEADHEEFHRAIGAYSYSGNGVSGYTLNSTTATNRRPIFEAGVIADEDKHTDLLAMSGNYTRSWITSAGAITSDWNNTEIIHLTGNQPIINVITNGLGSQVSITNNNYCAIFVFKIAVGADADSQRYRCVILQPQHQGTLTQMQAVNYTSVNINGLTGISNEIIFTQKIIVRYTGGNWTLTSVENISGNARFSVISSGVTAGVNELNVSMDARTNLTGVNLDENATIIDSYITNHKPFTTSEHTGTPNKLFGSGASGEAVEYIRDSFATSNATSGTITLVENQSLTLTETLTNAHTLTITPTVPTIFDPPRWQQLRLITGATLPSITWTTPAGVTFEFPDKPFYEGLGASKKVHILYEWVSSTLCIIHRREW